MKISRIKRLLQIIHLLQNRNGATPDSLTFDCGVSRRTIFRDLSLLRDVGVPYVFDEEERRYYLPAEYFLPPTNFTAQEALAVIVMCNELGNHSSVPLLSSARRAAAKLESGLPRELREYISSVSPKMAMQLVPNSAALIEPDHYETLVEAIARRESVRICYASYTEADDICTKLDPYRLLFSRRSWYVIGRSSMHRSVRTFNVGRISAVSELGDPYEIPAGFSLERYLRNAWHLIPEPGRDEEVHVRFDAMVAGNVAEVRWHKTQQTKFNADGSLDFHVIVSGLGEICWWILGYGDKAEVIRPPRLRALVADHARRMLERHTGPPSMLPGSDAATPLAQFHVKRHRKPS
ncbi:MAG: WYL domain-containing transcriptional regulator [Planctomycetales bacterium]|nr:WYL domain-containing transcriptional regulator [Planctomycetales bacterium]